MANDPKKKTETATDAAQGSGTASVPTSAPSSVKAEGNAPTSRERELQDEIDFLKEEVAELRAARSLGGPSEEQLHGIIDRLGEAVGAGVAKALAAERNSRLPGNFKKPPKPELPEEFKGPRTYIVGPKKAFQNGRLFAPGEKITIVDQFPSSDWTPVESAITAPAKAAPGKQGRASDQDVG